MTFKDEEGLLEYLKENDLNGLDSEFSWRTEALIKKFNAKGAHLNRWWVRTSVYWKCPCCKRQKDEIVRLNKHGYLICQLHEHHDHMKDVVKKRFEIISTAKKEIVADEQSERFAVKAAFSLSAYDNTIICADCNEADKNAKLAVKAHKDFSFSPNEISRFIIPQSNKEHEINTEIAKKLWDSSIETFELRMNLANYLAEIAASNKDWYQPSEETSLKVRRVSDHYFRQHGLRDISCEPEKLLYNTVVFTGDNDSWRTKVRAEVRKKPTQNQLAQLISTRGNYWKKVDESWVCPCCNRSKVDCVQPSKRNPWIFEVKHMPFYDTESNEDKSKRLICNECVNTAINLGLETTKESNIKVIFPSSLICFDELRSLITPRPHSPHIIDNQKCNELLPILIERAKESTNRHDD